MVERSATSNREHSPPATRLASIATYFWRNVAKRPEQPALQAPYPPVSGNGASRPESGNGASRPESGNGASQPVSGNGQSRPVSGNGASRPVEKNRRACALPLTANLEFASGPYFSWRQLGAQVSALVDFLEEQNVAPGTHVATCLPNSLEWITCDLALQTIGAVHVALDSRLPAMRARELAEFSQSQLHLDADWVESHATRFAASEQSPLLPTRLATLQHRAAQAHVQQPAMMLFTSGTVGRPKGVLLSHGNLVSNALAKLEAAPQRSGDVRINVLPFSHAYARTCELSTWIITASKLVVARDWESLLALSPSIQPTLLNLVPYLARKLAEQLELDQGSLGGKLRLLQIGGAAVSPDMFRRLKQLGLPPLQGYGLTEAAPVVCSNRAGQQRPGVVGPAVGGTQLRIDCDGVLWLRGEQVMLGYWRDEEATRRVLVEGWLRTGDLAEFVDEPQVAPEAGVVRILGRQSEQICLSTGYLVSPEEIEAEILRDPWCEQAAVIGDGQDSIHALLWLKLDALPQSYFSLDRRQLDTLDEKRVRRALEMRWKERFSDWPAHLQPRRIQLLPEPMSAEAGTLTAKGTPRRKALAELYAR